MRELVFALDYEPECNLVTDALAAYPETVIRSLSCHVTPESLWRVDHATGPPEALTAVEEAFLTAEYCSDCLVTEDCGADCRTQVLDRTDDTLDQQKDIWRPFTENVLDIASDHDNDVMVAASREAAIATVCDMDPDIPIAFFFSDSTDVGLEITREHDCEVIWPPINMVKRSPFWESPDYYVEDPDFEEVDLVEVAHEEGREIYVFTLNTGYEADQMRMAEVDGILSNYPNLLTYGEDPEDNADSVFEFDDNEESRSVARGALLSV